MAGDKGQYQPALPEIISAALTDPRIHDLLNERPALLLADAETVRLIYNELRFPMDQFWLMLESRQAIRVDPLLIKGLKKRGAHFG
ncbi:hypothetical protein ABMA58_21305, partial [Oceanospirillum sp. HFRX-1_2]